ncbi:hypothetical protein [Prevotella sp. 10(H)]|uniref:hypothetical protein n=1 Tax=Prevotella sp. 10(H) TaxID=1158294 RepID=UPI0012DC4857|nr:hypothetical protein [Prevotella sp. 10(H)]
MKKKIKYLSMLAFLAVFAISCSDTEEAAEPEKTLKAADSPLLVATPEELYFDIAVGNSLEKNVNIKNAGLSSLSALTNFTVIVQGADADQFVAEEPNLNLAQLLQALLGNGINIPVSYFPTESGPHEAELLVTATLLGVVAPVQKTIPLHGTTTALPGPVVVSTVPANGGSTTFDSRVPNVVGTPKGQYHIDIVFNQNITTTGDLDVEYLNTTGAEIQTIQVVNNNTLRITVWEESLSASVPHYLVIRGGSVRGTNNVVNQNDINLTYSVTGGIPN